ncbi:GAF domain-containing protein [Acuticoccus mangrovi]|uniref:GAF domain-containing protein n=1 Tax=Acuticoccus mangrovi TaxID=2796142 RepID=A0A934IH33_9HYPH|nr:GAF domain-containing protein [Acuticoccus mangrovi]MBJ3774871.1 GAF domain-containing protein [Acuticoccus mangrovi]
MPGGDTRKLELAGWQSTRSSAFHEAGRQQPQNYGEGIAGLAWRNGRPMVERDMAVACPGRSDEAADFVCAIAFPIFVGRFLLGVMAFFFAGPHGRVGAVEIWHAAPGANELGFFDGYFGNAEVFEITARHMHFGRGVGLPGEVWSRGGPVMMPQLNAPRFLNWESAQAVGFRSGIGVPLPCSAPGTWILNMFSSDVSPLARRFEVWSVSDEDESLILRSGHCSVQGDLMRVYDHHAVPFGVGVLGMVARCGIPAVSSDFTGEDEVVARSLAAAGLTRMQLLPIIRNAALTAIVALYQ